MLFLQQTTDNERYALAQSLLLFSFNNSDLKGLKGGKKIMKIYSRMTAYGLLAGAVALLGGCFGSFELTRTLYRFNRNVYSSVSGDSTQRKIAQSAVMWLFIPAYAGAGIADAVVLNVIEFWTGNRTTESSSLRGPAGTAISLAPSADGRQGILTVTRDGKVIARDHLVRISNKVLELRDEQGHLKGMVVRESPQQIQIQDPKGNTLRTLTALSM